jgi:hypothetical protein
MFGSNLGFTEPIVSPGSIHLSPRLYLPTVVEV